MIRGALLAVLASVATYCERDIVPNISPPTRLDLVMVPDGGQRARCDHYGGELIYHADRPDYVAWICEGVDY